MNEQESTGSTEAEVSTAPADAANTEPTTPESTNDNEQKQEAKFEYPKKFLKADGTPDYERLAKSYVGLEKKLGAKPFIPAQSPEEYEWEAPENGVELDEEGLNQFKSEALEQGFTPKQYQFLMSRYNDVVTGMRDAGPTPEKSEAALKSEWGKDYTTQLTYAKTAFDEFAPSDADINDPVWNHPAVMKLLARLGSEVREDSITPKAAAGASGRMSEEEVATIMKSKAYRDGDQALHKQVTAWYQGRK